MFLTNLEPYIGNWTKAHATHLLTRAAFGPKRSDIQWSVDNGLEATINNLFQEKQLPDPPIYHRYTGDPEVPVGETWVNTPAGVGGINTARRASLNAWWAGLILNDGFSIGERMTLFWHEHFPVSTINQGRQGYHYSTILRSNALGNFRTLIEELTISPAILIYLNGNDNTREAPNENYSRELLELFTIGKGLAAGPGDYTNYTEEDVFEIAKALTGWVSRNTDSDNEIKSTFRPNRHDNSVKKLSARFDNIEISDEGENEYKTVIDIILRKNETARFLCRQLHIWFVSSNITAEVEANIIEPMAQILFENDYEIQPALEALLLSNYFNSGDHNGCMINSPYDFITKVFNTFELNQGDNFENQYRVWSVLFDYARLQNMELMSLPTVAGWKAFYQEPSYYQFWINSVSLNERERFIDIILEQQNNFFNLDLVDFFASLDNPYEINEMIKELASIFFAFPITDNQIEFLKNIVIPGLPEYVWGEQYAEFLNSPDDQDLRTSITRKMHSLTSTMLKMPEFYLH